MPKPETPLLTVDAVIMNDQNNLVLIRRKDPHFKGVLALPGGFVDVGETVEDACIRETYEETNIKVKIKRLIGVFSDPNRDPRGHSVTVAFLCEPVSKDEKPLAKDDATAIEIVKFEELHSKRLAFDHFEIIKYSGILKNQQ